MATTIDNLYAEYEQACGSESPGRTRDDLRELWHASELSYGGETPSAFWILVFGEEGDVDRWADGGADWPTENQWRAFATARCDNPQDTW